MTLLKDLCFIVGVACSAVLTYICLVERFWLFGRKKIRHTPPQGYRKLRVASIARVLYGVDGISTRSVYQDGHLTLKSMDGSFHWDVGVAMGAIQRGAYKSSIRASRSATLDSKSS